MGMHRQFSWLFGSTRRISDVLLVLDELDASQPVAEEVRWKARHEQKPRREQCVSLVDAAITSPGGQLLAQNLSFSVDGSGQRNLLITGTGKSALVRALIGLWPLSKGHVEWPDAGVVVIPQAPLVSVLPISLLDYCTYPLQLEIDSAAAAVAIANLTKSMQSLRVHYLVQHSDDGWHAVKEWESELSKGEAQCIGIVRALYHRPSWAVLDDVTSAMAEDRVGDCYRLLQERGISYISTVQSGPAMEVLRPFHSQELTLVTTPACVPREIMNTENKSCV